MYLMNFLINILITKFSEKKIARKTVPALLWLKGVGFYTPAIVIIENAFIDCLK